MTSIATLNAILRLDSKPFDDGRKKVSSSLGDLNKGFEKSALSAEKLGSAIAARFLGAAAIIGLTVKLVNGLRQEWKQLSEMEMTGTLPLDKIKSQMKELEKVANNRRWTEGVATFFSGEDTVGEMREEVNNAINLIRTREQIVERGRAMADAQARLTDAIKGTNEATRALALQRHGGNADLIALQHRLEDISALRAKVDALLGAGKTGAERFAESQRTLNDALKEGLVTLEEYERALERLRRSQGRAVEINARTMVREAARPMPTSRTSNATSSKEVVFVLKEIHNTLSRDGAATRLR